MNKFKQTILSLCREMVEKEEDLDEITTTAATPGYSTPYAFSKNKKKKKKELGEALEKKDIDLVKSMIRAEVASIFRDVWLKRNAWK